MKFLKSLPIVLGLLAMPVAVQAQDAAAYPERPVKVIVPFPPGGATDIVGREISDRLARALGQPFVVENRSGASGNIGMEAAARAAPDGYTLVVGAPQTLTINPQLFKSNPFNPQKELDPIVVVATVPNVLIVNPKLPISSVKDLISYSKARPGKVNYGSSSIGGTPHLSSELFKSMTGTDIMHIPYRGSSPALTDLMGGQIDIMFDNLPAALPHIKSGRVKALAVTTKQRSDAAPELPTMDEAGVPGFESQGWFSLLAPAGTPPAILEKINAEVNKILATDTFKERLANVGAQPKGGSIADFRELLNTETQRWSEVIRFADIKVE
ncbi:Bug family tripartite tricarboxylate transporter substrate binding protein [Parapusillimonas granuli]|uniref:Tripartite tricarboxylate transporter substrate binding protein n=1 Tax=Parapusillimonas granuli TaxID=380911 RepID=A0A853G6Q7_9BURK|nr:tripartite tricarboxylate transporter substrate binding protein [Parapusillimonas granuli]MBB5216928.1 tripartite-type tricarboxylate transporter receptor subunit TctC [Parapusillimonas granuli]NYT50306.1 tripartite tricarboxylate transporter substrate binding protein [Parapusillimonas granuli]